MDIKIPSVAVVLTSLASIFGFAVGNNTANQQIATVQSTSIKEVLLVRNTAKAYFTNGESDKKNITLEGNFCFRSNLSTGSLTSPIVWATRADNGARLYNPSSPDSDTLKYNNFSAGFGFPVCSNIDNQNNLADLGKFYLPETKFKLNLFFNQPLSSTNCPDLYLNFNSTQREGKQFSRIKLKDFGLCSAPEVNPSPTMSPSGIIPSLITVSPRLNPTQVINTATITPVPTFEIIPTNTDPVILTPIPTTLPENKSGIGGIIAIKSCQSPQEVNINYCRRSGQCYNLPFSNLNSPGLNNIWLINNSYDTWIYQYQISNYGGGDLLKTDDMITFSRYSQNGPAYAVINNYKYVALEDFTNNLSVKVPGSFDFFITVPASCPCNFTTKAYIRDPNTKEFISDFDNQADRYGIANNRQIVFNQDKPTVGFTEGQYAIGPVPIVKPEKIDAFSYGEDDLASVKVFIDENKYRIVGQECKSLGKINACPNGTVDWSATAIKVRHPNIIDGLRVTCGTNVEYGWLLEKK